MPRIQEYLPETGAPGPVGGLDPKTEAVGRIGAGIEKLGSSISEVGAHLYREESNSEISQASVASSQRNVDYQQRLIEETQNGSLDVNKFKQDYQDEIDQERGQYQTQAGKDYFDRVSARTGMHLSIAAAHGASQIAGRQAAVDWQSELNSNATAITQDPSSFEKRRGQMLDGIQARVEHGTLDAKNVPKFEAEANATATMAAIEGWAKLGETQYTDTNGKPIAGPDVAKFLLDSKKVDAFLTLKQREDMYGKIKMQIHVNKADAAQQLHDQKLQQEKALDDWYSKNASRMDQVKPSEVAGNPSIPGHVQWQIINGIKERATKATRPDSAVVTEMTDRMVLPDGDPNKIVNPQELIGQVDYATYGRIMGYYNKSEDGKAANGLRKTLFDGAKRQIIPTDQLSLANNVAHPGNMKAQTDNYLRFQTDFHQAEKQLILDKKPLTELANPDSKDYFFKTHPIENYKVTNPLAAAAKQTTQDALKNAPKGAMVRDPHETIDQFEARKAKAKQ